MQMRGEPLSVRYARAPSIRRAIGQVGQVTASITVAAVLSINTGFSRPVSRW
jgi:hypothetical protein